MKTFREIKPGDHIYYLINNDELHEHNAFYSNGDENMQLQSLLDFTYNTNQHDKYEIYECEVLECEYPSKYSTKVYHMDMRGHYPCGVGSSDCYYYDAKSITLKVKSKYGISSIKFNTELYQESIIKGGIYFTDKTSVLKYFGESISKDIKNLWEDIDKKIEMVETLKRIRDNIKIEPVE